MNLKQLEVKYAELEIELGRIQQIAFKRLERLNEIEYQLKCLLRDNPKYIPAEKVRKLLEDL